MNENQVTPITPQVSPSPVMPAPIVSQSPAMPPAQSHTGLWVGLVLVIIALLAAGAGYWYLMQSDDVATEPIVEQAALIDPEVAALEAELQAESLDDLGAELGAIEQELAP